ncbi:glycerol dehydratase reactivase beta/small subunit family protein [Acrocarpospora catenulata]|uniref:glycerol dehydratase reactivase beta/small subunit family protein n=1 Tax=Acrocarpospora catenulata TaxID=2836182 RepID=UPI001BDADB6C|nr:glycerol dehydratase reactivase beta/small subunit family protein [Acrocarpospora catenulata]
MLSGDLHDRRADREKRTRPTVVVRYRPVPANRRCLRELGAGLEEEGVPFRAEPVGEDSTARELAYGAALASDLDVGVGVDAAGNTCVHHAKLPPEVPALAGPPSAARGMGHNAARLVVGIPFKTIDQ